jgi:hypothetical protein
VLLPLHIVVQGDDPAAWSPAQDPARRVPRTSLAPRMSLAPRPRDNAPARSPDQARALIASIRQGWRNGSAADPNPDSNINGAQA